MRVSGPLDMDQPPQWRGAPGVVPAEVNPPALWQGLPVHWDSSYSGCPVFIAQFGLRDGHEVYLFGVRFDLSRAAIRGRSLSEGFFVEYLVLDCFRTGHAIQRLCQHRTPTYAAEASAKDYISADDLSGEQVQRLSLANPPKWKVEDAVWPTLDGRPMVFVGQAVLVDNEVTRHFLVWDKTVFLFSAGEDNDTVFKIVTQDLEYESAEDHYARE